MAFEAPTSLDLSDDGFLRPAAPPPANPPPPPPPAETNNDNNTHNYGSTFSTPYQPTIVHYYEDNIEQSPATKQAKRALPFEESTSHPQSSFASFRGDTSLRPNIGASNAAIGQESLRESMWKMRLVNLGASVLALLSEIPNLLGKVFTVNLAGAVLGGYLFFFALLLLGYELDMWGADFIKHNFGLIHHPVGRSLVLLLMGGLSVGQGGIINVLLGVVFLWSSGYTLATFVWYPEYRRRVREEEQNQFQRDSLLHEAIQNNQWATPENLARSALVASGEAAALLQKKSETKTINTSIKSKRTTTQQ